LFGISLFSKIIWGVNFNFERAPLELQRFIKSKMKEKQGRERGGKKEGGALGSLWKKTEFTGAV
jgi:hypothetical protein